MKLASGVATVEDFETGEYHEEYKVVFERKTSRYLEAIRWFAKSKYKKVLIVPEKEYSTGSSLRIIIGDSIRKFVQPDDCWISVVQKYNRVYLEKS